MWRARFAARHRIAGEFSRDSLQFGSLPQAAGNDLLAMGFA
jgi:hypothetical protein